MCCSRRTQAVLALALRATNPDDSRITDEPAAVAELARLCGHLPLALRIIAELLADQPERPVSGDFTPDAGHGFMRLGSA
jgi:hypothetical protein